MKPDKDLTEQLVVKPQNFQQLPLQVSLREDFIFDNFISLGNEPSLSYLQTHLTGRKPFFLYLWGKTHAGCSHLLQAACQHLPEQNTAVYLPLDKLKWQGPKILQGMESMNLVCIDELQLIAGDKQWEEALFHFFNRVFDQGNSIITAAKSAPQTLGIKLPDLSSRISSAVVYQIKELDDAGKLSLLKARALSQGLTLSSESAHYILNRAGRSMQELMSIMKFLDHQSLSANRKLTIPFIKQAMSW